MKSQATATRRSCFWNLAVNFIRFHGRRGSNFACRQHGAVA